MNMQEMMKQLQGNPQEFFRRAGVNVPTEIMNDPKAMVMHLLQTKQVSNPVMQQIMPMIRQIGGR